MLYAVYEYAYRCCRWNGVKIHSFPAKKGPYLTGLLCVSAKCVQTCWRFIIAQGTQKIRDAPFAAAAAAHGGPLWWPFSCLDKLYPNTTTPVCGGAYLRLTSLVLSCCNRMPPGEGTPTGGCTTVPAGPTRKPTWCHHVDEWNGWPILSQQHRRHLKKYHQKPNLRKRCGTRQLSLYSNHPSIWMAIRHGCPGQCVSNVSNVSKLNVHQKLLIKP